MIFLAFAIGIICGVVAARSLARRWRGQDCGGRILVAGALTIAGGFFALPFFLAAAGVAPAPIVAFVAWVFAAAGLYLIAAVLIAVAPDLRSAPAPSSERFAAASDRFGDVDDGQLRAKR